MSSTSRLKGCIMAQGAERLACRGFAASMEAQLCEPRGLFFSKDDGETSRGLQLHLEACSSRKGQLCLPANDFKMSFFWGGLMVSLRLSHDQSLRPSLGRGLFFSKAEETAKHICQGCSCFELERAFPTCRNPPKNGLIRGFL